MTASSVGSVRSSSRFLYRLARLALVSTLTLAAQTPSPAYLADMPSVDRVKAQIQGTDPTDTAARQVAVLTYLQQYIQRIKDPHAAYTPDEARVMGAYSTAAYQIQQDYNKTHTPAEAKAFDTLQFNYMLNHGDEWARSLIGKQSAAAYQASLNDMGARQQAHVNSINRSNQPTAPASNASNTNDPTSLAARRCAELGGTAGGCATKSFGQGLLAMFGGDQLSNEVESVQTVGVYLSGNYSSPGTNTFLSFTLDSAQVTSCGKLVPDDRAYKLRRTPSGVQITVANQPAPITLALRPDGSLAGPGPVLVNGRIVTGYSNQTTTLVHQNGAEASGCNGAYGSCRTTTSTPIYAPSSARCSIATLTPPAPSNNSGGDNSSVGGLVGLLNSVVPNAEPGLRMNGKFASPTGLILDFEGGAVILDCGHAHVKAPYSVQNTPAEFRISVNNPGGPFTLTLAPDNTLHGDGTTTVNGRLFVSMDANANPAFRPVSTTCSVNTFSSKSPAEYKALITNPPSPGR